MPSRRRIWASKVVRPASCADSAPFLFASEMGKRKGGEGNFSFPSPLPSKRAAFQGPPPFFAAVQQIIHRHQSWFLLHQGDEIPPQWNISRGAPWGSAEGGIPPLRFLSHRFLCKESGAPSGQDARAASASPGWQGCQVLSLLSPLQAKEHRGAVVRAHAPPDGLVQQHPGQLLGASLLKGA